MNTRKTPLHLLKQKRFSALIDARNIESQLSHLSKSSETAGMRTNLLCIKGMFRDHIANLDAAIRASIA
jgi:hypothetical protein